MLYTRSNFVHPVPVPTFGFIFARAGRSRCRVEHDIRSYRLRPRACRSTCSQPCRFGSPARSLKVHTQRDGAAAAQCERDQQAGDAWWSGWMLEVVVV